uniref:C2H2-type domain-containing protein n=1 Tax=Anopheles atroparvus TaxID=41427 RepID=A0A182IKG8_ANOAO
MDSAHGSSSKNDSIQKSDLNLLVKNIVKILLTTSKYFHCPFCADEYLFEFTLKHHLLKNHERDLEKIVKSPDASIRFCESNICPYCGALFYYISALPKHIMNSHSRECLFKWQAIEKENSLARKLAADPSIQCVPCSPGLSDLFDELSTSGRGGGVNGGSVIQLTKPSPLLKKALRNVNRITAGATGETAQHQLIGGPEATSAWSSFGFDSSLPRRTHQQHQHHSVRRELRFGDDRVPSTGDSSTSIRNLLGGGDGGGSGSGGCSPSPSTETVSSVRKPKFQRKRFNLRSIKPKLNFRKYVLSKFSKKYHCKIVTSTPNNFLDDGSSRDSARFLHNQERWNRIHFE